MPTDTPTPAGLTAVEAALDDFASALRDATYEDANVFALTSRREMLNAVAEEERVAVLDAVRAALDAVTAALAEAEKGAASDKALADAVGAFLTAYDDEHGSTWGDVERFVPAMRSAFAALAPAARPTDAEARA